MELDLPDGLYVVAVSGGVDSMVLLDLIKQNGVNCVVAHFNHGIRDDSDKDEHLVAVVTKQHGFRFEARRGKLGQDTSEAEARVARYNFLEEIQKKYGADAIITAHHQDDLIETAIINMLRGTGPRGLSSIMSSKVKRPLLNYSKKTILKYALDNQIAWHEDSTNNDNRLLRNYVRRNLTPRLSSSEKVKFIKAIEESKNSTRSVDKLISNLSQTINKDGRIERGVFSLLPSDIGDELTSYWLRQEGMSQFDRSTIQRLSNSLRTARPGTSHSVSNGLYLRIGLKDAHFMRTV